MRAFLKIFLSEKFSPLLMFVMCELHFISQMCHENKNNNIEKWHRLNGKNYFGVIF
jgi:hypothetical protein